MRAVESQDKEDKLLLDALTPIIKSWPSDFCVEANNLAIQVLGGYGYTRDFPLQQIWRDNRLNMIHEGTAGIQSLDLLGRKTRGEGWGIMVGRMEEAAERCKSVAGMEEMAAGVREAAEKLEETKVKLLKCMEEDPELALGNSHEFMTMTGHVVVGWMWLELATTAAHKLEAGDCDGQEDFYRGQIQAAKWFHVFELGKVARMGDVLGGLDRTVVDMKAEWM